MATGVGADNASFKLADSFQFSGSDYSNPSASSAGYTNYKTGGLYNVSGKSDQALGLGKVIMYSAIILTGYWLYNRINRG